MSEPAAQPPPTRRRSVTRERLLDAAAEVFGERGITAASVEEICERAGYTRGAFYSNFANKDELVVALLDREEILLLERLAIAVNESLTAADPLAAVSERLFYVQAFGEANFRLRAELSLLAVRDPAVAKAYLASRRAFRERFVPFLERGVAAASRRLVVPAGDALDTLEAVFEASVRTSIVTQGSANPPDNLARRMLPVILAAITEPLAP
jgi:AcrR family transcriptional regulator